MRGKLSGLYNTAESLGRFSAAVVFPVTYAWSISPSGFGWVDHRLVFYVFGLALALGTVVAWRTLTADIYAQHGEAELPVNEGDGVDAERKANASGNGPGSRPGRSVDCV